jgi:hypothetical protein
MIFYLDGALARLGVSRRARVDLGRELAHHGRLHAHHEQPRLGKDRQWYAKSLFGLRWKGHEHAIKRKLVRAGRTCDRGKDAAPQDRNVDARLHHSRRRHIR